MKCYFIATILASTLLMVSCDADNRADREAKHIDSFLDESAYLVLNVDDVSLVGPYDYIDTISPNELVLDAFGESNSLVVRVRGTLPTNNTELDKHAMRMLSLPQSQAYLLEGSLLELDESTVTAILYKPMESYHKGTDFMGRMYYEVMSYSVPKIMALAYGYALVDRSDPENPLYDDFLEAEAFAKKHKMGYWAESK